MTVKCRTAIRALFLYLNLCLRVKLNSLSCSFTFISFLTNFKLRSYIFNCYYLKTLQLQCFRQNSICYVGLFGDVCYFAIHVYLFIVFKYIFLLFILCRFLFVFLKPWYMEDNSVLFIKGNLGEATHWKLILYGGYVILKKKTNDIINKNTDLYGSEVWEKKFSL